VERQITARTAQLAPAVDGNNAFAWSLYVAAGEGGSQFRRLHRAPGTHPLGWAQILA